MKITVTVSAIVSFIIGIIISLVFIFNATDYGIKLLMFFISLSISGVTKSLLDLYINIWKVSIQNEFTLKLAFSPNNEVGFLNEQKEEYEETLKELDELTKYSNKLTIILSIVSIIILFLAVNG